MLTGEKERALRKAIEYRPAVRGPRIRKLGDFYEFQKSQGRQILDPVPIYPGVKPSPHLVWNSVYDFVEYVRRTPGCQPTMCDNPSAYGYASNNPDIFTSNGQKWNQQGKEREGSGGWYCNEIIALHDSGWKQGYDLVKDDMAEAMRVATMAAIEDEDMLREVHGSVVDVPTYLSGDPECMFEFQTTVKEVLRVEIDVDYFYGGSLPPIMYLYRGVAIMAAVMALRRLGVFVDLYAQEVSSANTTVSNDRRVKHTCKIYLMKEGMTENISETLIAVAHPAFNWPLFYQAQCMGWGCIPHQGICSQNRDFREFDQKAGSGKLVIPGVFSDSNLTTRDADNVIDWENFWATPEAAAQMVKMMLKAAANVSRT
jgi:hypothetical protein